MLGQVVGGNTVAVLEEVMQFAQARHEVLAGNVANLSTPGYRTRDLSVDEFQQRLGEAIRSQSSYQRQPIDGIWKSSPGDPMRKVSESVKTILYHDGSDVGLEQQVTEIVKNRMMHNLAVSLLQSQFQMLQTAISERVSV